MGIDTQSIEESVELDLNYPTVSNRYFTHYFFMPINPYKKTYNKSNCKSSDLSNEDKTKKSLYTDAIESRICSTGEDTRILMHSNRMCVITLPPNHPILLKKKTIEKIDFSVSGINRLSNKVSGKGKRGAQIVGLFSPLCSLHCSDGSSYIVYTGVRGKLIEVNERLVENPNLICECPDAEGYLAVVMPKLQKKEEFKDFLLSREEYESASFENST